jgi:hypothetical protein
MAHQSQPWHVPGEPGGLTRDLVARDHDGPWRRIHPPSPCMESVASPRGGDVGDPDAVRAGCTASNCDPGGSARWRLDGRGARLKALADSLEPRVLSGTEPRVLSRTEPRVLSGTIPRGRPRRGRYRRQRAHTSSRRGETRRPAPSARHFLQHVQGRDPWRKPQPPVRGITTSSAKPAVIAERVGLELVVDSSDHGACRRRPCKAATSHGRSLTPAVHCRGHCRRSQFRDICRVVHPWRMRLPPTAEISL